jgi:mannose-1-phosphate guanylyltransferase/mannose-6-phosphate isomerase
MIHPVILAGGSGTRLWPISRKSYPKQFAPVLGGDTLFQSTLSRFDAPDFAPPLILTSEPFRFIVAEQAAMMGIAPSGIFLEPDGRNNAAPVLIAALHLAEQDPDALMLIAPCDHLIPDADGFRRAVRAGQAAADTGQIVTFGIEPTRAETGYGYLERSGAGVDPAPLHRFVEKPDPAQAEAMIAAGTYLWNSGVFLANAATILEAYRAHMPDMMASAVAAIRGAVADLDFIRLNAEPWAQMQDISIDYAIMEKAQNLSVVPYYGVWSDLGDWQAVHRESAPDADGNVVQGAATALDCEGSLLRSDDPDTRIVGLGLRDVIAVATGDAVLVADAARAQDVRLIVERLQAEGAREADDFRRTYRPWGWYETLALGPRFQVKRIVVKPGGVLSLQSHQHRSEHWVVVEGTASVTIGEDTRLVTENESVYVPLGAKHRMENTGKMPMVLIEVQTGGYLGEDDITRYEDIYGRG